MKIIIKFLLISFFSINALHAENISAKVSDLISKMVPGEGYTETSIDLRENNSPDFSILAVS